MDDDNIINERDIYYALYIRASKKLERAEGYITALKARMGVEEDIIWEAQKAISNLIDNWPPEHDPESTDPNNMDQQFIDLEELKKILNRELPCPCLEESESNCARCQGFESVLEAPWYKPNKEEE